MNQFPPELDIAVSGGDIPQLIPGNPPTATTASRYWGRNAIYSVISEPPSLYLMLFSLGGVDTYRALKSDDDDEVPDILDPLPPLGWGNFLAGTQASLASGGQSSYHLKTVNTGAATTSTSSDPYPSLVSRVELWVRSWYTVDGIPGSHPFYKASVDLADDDFGGSVTLEVTIPAVDNRPTEYLQSSTFTWNFP